VGKKSGAKETPHNYRGKSKKTQRTGALTIHPTKLSWGTAAHGRNSRNLKRNPLCGGNEEGGLTFGAIMEGEDTLRDASVAEI